VQFAEPNLKIVGGQIAYAKSWPSMALIFYKFNNKGYNTTIVCGGSLISRNVVLTAAHCIAKTYNGYFVSPQPTYEAMLTVYLGVHDIYSLSTYPCVKRVVSKVFMVSFLNFIYSRNC
jgi:hypothetical protein